MDWSELPPPAPVDETPTPEPESPTPEAVPVPPAIEEAAVPLEPGIPAVPPAPAPPAVVRRHTVLPLPPPGEDVFPTIIHKPTPPAAAAHTAKKTLALFDYPVSVLTPIPAPEPAAQFYSMPGLAAPTPPVAVPDVLPPQPEAVRAILPEPVPIVTPVITPGLPEASPAPEPEATPPAPNASPEDASVAFDDIDFNIPELELDLSGTAPAPAAPEAHAVPAPDPAAPAPTYGTPSLDELTQAAETAPPEPAPAKEKPKITGGSSLERLAALFSKPAAEPAPPEMVPETVPPLAETVETAPHPEPTIEAAPFDIGSIPDWTPEPSPAPPEAAEPLSAPPPTEPFSMEMPDFLFDFEAAEEPPAPEPAAPAPVGIEDYAASLFDHDDTMDLIAHLASPVSPSQEMDTPRPEPLMASTPIPVAIAPQPQTVQATTESGLESVHILATAELSEEFQMMLVQHGATFAVMVDNGENAVILKSFDYNPLPFPVDPDRFRIAETAAAGTKRMYVIQVGDWQGIVSLESDEARLQAEI